MPWAEFLSFSLSSLGLSTSQISSVELYSLTPETLRVLFRDAGSAGNAHAYGAECLVTAWLLEMVQSQTAPLSFASILNKRQSSFFLNFGSPPQHTGFWFIGKVLNKACLNEEQVLEGWAPGGPPSESPLWTLLPAAPPNEGFHSIPLHLGSTGLFVAACKNLPLSPSAPTQARGGPAETCGLPGYLGTSGRISRYD